MKVIKPPKISSALGDVRSAAVGGPGKPMWVEPLDSVDHDHRCHMSVGAASQPSPIAEPVQSPSTGAMAIAMKASPTVTGAAMSSRESSS